METVPVRIETGDGRRVGRPTVSASGAFRCATCHRALADEHADLDLLGERWRPTPGVDVRPYEDAGGLWVCAACFEAKTLEDRLPASAGHREGR